MRDKTSTYSISIFVIGLLLASFIFSQLIFPVVIDDDKDLTVRIGVVDSGCSEAQSSFVSEYKSFTTTQFGFFYDDNKLYDDLNHGTHVCNIIHREAPNAEIFSARIASYDEINNIGVLTYQSILAAIEWLVEEAEVEIINLSLGSVPYVTDILDEVFVKYQNETIFVAASGNTGTDSFLDIGHVDWPATYPWVIGVNSYDPNNSSLAADYAVGGVSYFGQYVTQYLESGIEVNKRGSSFAAPRVTGKIGQLMHILRQQGLDPSLNELQAIYTSLTIGWENEEFNSLTGWGRLNVDLLSGNSDNLFNSSSTITSIHAPDEVDLHSRFFGETWSRSWKISNFGIDPFTIGALQFNGNGTELIDGIKIDSYPWGNLLTLNFEGRESSGFYSLNISSSNSNTFTYGINLKSNPIGKILFDHRTSINGYGHPYAEYINFEEYLRSLGYIVNHALLDSDNIDLAVYDSIILTKFSEALTEQNFSISRFVSNEQMDNYETYVRDGGSLVILTNLKGLSNSTQINNHISRFNAEFSSKDIGSYLNFPLACCPEKVSNFTGNQISDGVDEFFYYGSQVKSTNENTSEIGWIINVETVAGFVLRTYLSIGVFGTLDLGNFMILGGSNFMSNTFFTDPSMKGFNTLYENFLEL
ncbi:MAG: S8/S53 family peptidase [Candidatus Heimdallarchaeota archaeon]|nr:S8/S53 family peptidase [Candidatus Heimdallarchaeota archaeon]